MVVDVILFVTLYMYTIFKISTSPLNVASQVVLVVKTCLPETWVVP